MKNLLKIFQPKPDTLIEGVYAHDYPDVAQKRIKDDYVKRWGCKAPLAAPDTHPWLFDPCNPPEEWYYDPYYETWIRTNGS